MKNLHNKALQHSIPCLSCCSTYKSFANVVFRVLPWAPFRFTSNHLASSNRASSLILPAFRFMRITPEFPIDFQSSHHQSLDHQNDRVDLLDTVGVAEVRNLNFHVSEPRQFQFHGASFGRAWLTRIPSLHADAFDAEPERDMCRLDSQSSPC